MDGWMDGGRDGLREGDNENAEDVWLFLIDIPAIFPCSPCKTAFTNFRPPSLRPSVPLSNTGRLPVVVLLQQALAFLEEEEEEEEEGVGVGGRGFFSTDRSTGVAVRLIWEEEGEEEEEGGEGEGFSGRRMRLKDFLEICSLGR